MRSHTLAALPLVLATFGCGSSPPSMPSGDAGSEAATASGDASTDRPTVTQAGRVRVTVTYAGRVMPGAVLQLYGARTMTFSAPGEAYAVVKDPTFPATGELYFGEAGTYWIFARLNAPPVEAISGPEDRDTRSMAPVEVSLGRIQELTLALPTE